MSEGNYFTKLFGINVSDKIEKKNGLSYVSWCYAWSEVKKLFPDATYTVYENAQGWNYHTDGRTCWVKTGVTVNGIEHIEMLPVMDFKNRSIPVEQVTSFDVNKAIQRSLTKACARHGLGLYVYAGEDLPEEEAKKQIWIVRMLHSVRFPLHDHCRKKLMWSETQILVRFMLLQALLTPLLFLLFIKLR